VLLGGHRPRDLWIELGGEHSPQGAQHGAQPGGTAADVDRPGEFGGESVDLGRVGGVGKFATDRGDRLAAAVGVGPGQKSQRGQSLQLGVDLEVIANHLGGELGDEHANVWLADHDALIGQSDKRFAHGDPADSQVVGDLVLRDPVAAAQPAVEDHLPDDGGDLIAGGAAIQFGCGHPRIIYNLQSVQHHLFLPQMRMSPNALIDRARAAEQAGFDGLALMDHLAPPMAEDKPMYEALVTATWLAACTSRLTLSHLVLCDWMRHPAVLARQALSLYEFSGGRFELGIGSGSVPDELGQFGLGQPDGRERTQRLAESLEVITGLWSGAPFSYAGEHFTLTDAQQLPAGRVPIVIGGSGPKTLGLVAKHADWWNLPVHQLQRMDDARSKIGAARISIQTMIAYVADESQRATITEMATKRFGGHRRNGGLLIGNASEISEQVQALAAQGVERCYWWFTDFADPATLAAFGSGVIGTQQKREN